MSEQLKQQRAVEGVEPTPVVSAAHYEQFLGKQKTLELMQDFHKALFSDLQALLEAEKDNLDKEEIRTAEYVLDSIARENLKGILEQPTNTRLVPRIFASRLMEAACMHDCFDAVAEYEVGNTEKFCALALCEKNKLAAKLSGVDPHALLRIFHSLENNGRNGAKHLQKLMAKMQEIRKRDALTFDMREGMPDEALIALYDALVGDVADTSRIHDPFDHRVLGLDGAGIFYQMGGFRKTLLQHIFEKYRAAMEHELAVRADEKAMESVYQGEEDDRVYAVAKGGMTFLDLFVTGIYVVEGEAAYVDFGDDMTQEDKEALLVAVLEAFWTHPDTNRNARHIFGGEWEIRPKLLPKMAESVGLDVSALEAFVKEHIAKSPVRDLVHQSTYQRERYGGSEGI